MSLGRLMCIPEQQWVVEYVVMRDISAYLGKSSVGDYLISKLVILVGTVRTRGGACQQNSLTAAGRLQLSTSFRSPLVNSVKHMRSYFKLSQTSELFIVLWEDRANPWESKTYHNWESSPTRGNIGGEHSCIFYRWNVKPPWTIIMRGQIISYLQAGVARQLQSMYYQGN